MKVQIMNSSSNDNPAYSTNLSAGMDIRSNENTVVPAQGRVLVHTGIKMAIPKGYEIQVRPRSGLALKSGITVLNTPGTIDADYRGEVGVILFNSTNIPFEVKVGDRIAQIILNKIETIEWESVDSLDETERGTGGFGHSGVK